MNQGFWMAKGAGCINDGELNYENSSGVVPKRSHQWFLDGAEADLFPNKKRAVAVPTANFFTGLLNSTIAPWSNGSSFQSMSGHYGERLFDTETDNVRAVNFDDRSFPSVNSDKVNVVRKFEEDSFDNDSPFGLSVSHSLEDPRTSVNYGRIRKVKISQVKEPENFSSFPMEHAFNRVDSNVMSATHAYDKADENSISMGLPYNKGDDSVMSVGETYNSENNIFISMGQSYNKGDESISMNQAYKEGTNNLASGVSNSDNYIISMGQPYNKAAESTISMGRIYNKGSDSTALTGKTYNKDESNNLSIGHSFSRGESTIISFGGCDADEDDTNPSGQIISSYDLLMVQSSLQRSEAINCSELITSNTDALMSAARIASSGAEIASKKREDAKTSKKASPNNFPSNVRSLLSTGMLDEVPVKYIAWSREKELRGVIKGSGYLCGCQECNFNKIVNAYEFERHANCKTKHPNNHIYFENGKTIYGIVQELRSTPQSMLFEVIQTITGSAINQKSFRLWKESFLAATRELQRIYGQDEGKPL